MANYAAWIERSLSRPMQRQALWKAPRTSRLSVEDSRNTIVVSPYMPPREVLNRFLDGPPRVLVLPVQASAPAADVQLARYRLLTNPIEWDSAVDQAVQAGCDTVVFLIDREDVFGKTLLRLCRLGIRRCLFWRGDRLTGGNPQWLAASRMFDRLRPRPISRGHQCKEFLRRIPRTSVSPSAQSRVVPWKIAHYIHGLNSGGAERQVCNLAALQHQAGHRVKVLLREVPEGANGHYAPLLARAGVPFRQAGFDWQEGFERAWRERGLSAKLFATLPGELRRMVADLVGELLTDPVDILHCYVDDCNIAGFVASRVVGVPVVVSMRNGNPTRFPSLIRPWMKPWYRAAAGDPFVSWASNSIAGARDYEQWIGLPPDRFQITRNAFLPPPAPPADEVTRLRSALGIAEGQPVVLGVFRLDPQKQPELFVEVVDRVRRTIPGLRALHIGIGPSESGMRKLIRRRNLEGVLTLHGQQSDVATWFQIADVLLLTSHWEGTPNAVLEAQHFGCVPVVTRGGGTPEAVRAEQTAFVHDVRDASGLARSVALLLGDARVRQRMADAGREFVQSEFSANRAFDDVTAVYERLFAKIDAGCRRCNAA